MKNRNRQKEHYNLIHQENIKRKKIKKELEKNTKIIVFSFFFFSIVFSIYFLPNVFYNKNTKIKIIKQQYTQGHKRGGTTYYSNSNRQVRAFYDRAKDAEERYSKKGKKINVFYITGTYHILKEYRSDIETKKFDNKMINKMCDKMLGDSTVYSESNYREYLEKEFFPSFDFSESKSKIATQEVFEYINQYLEKKGRKATCSNTIGGECDYSFPGIVTPDGRKINKEFSFNNLQVRLMSDSSSYCKGPNNDPLGEDLYNFEYYVLGTTYGEIGMSAFPKEVEKAHTIVSRSFSLARGIEMEGTGKIKYTNENGKDILQIRPCIADHIFCNPDKGCSADGAIQIDNYNGHQLYSGLSHPVKWMSPLSESGNITIKSAWEETIGMVGVDEEGRVVQTGFSNGQGNQDDWVWKRWAGQGMDYVQILLSAYPNIKEIKEFNCNTKVEEADNKFLNTASSLWKKIADGNYSYTLNGVSIPPSGNFIDCSSFVSWVLYEYGFKEEFGNSQHDTVAFLNTNWTEKMGWEEISVGAGEDVTNKLQPGDILVRDTGAGGEYGHINIIAEITSDQRVLVYDCGGETNWQNNIAKQGKPIENSAFAKSDNRPGKIIRISDESGNKCTSAASGEWQTWRQYEPAPWAHVPLGNSGLDIQGYGCFVTSIAIQIARSGAQTTLSDFNPGTFVQELNKYNSFSSDGNFVGGNNISKIVPSFETIAAGFPLPADKKGKISTIKGYIDQGYYVILRVKTTTGQHWVAVTGVTSDGIQMVDPSSDTEMVWDEYPVSESTEINVYKIG